MEKSTDDRATLKPLLEPDIENEKKTILLGLERTRERLARFEKEYMMTSTEFERRMNALELTETVEFSEWRMEIGMLDLLERQCASLKG
jgi:hypothetical protein